MNQKQKFKATAKKCSVESKGKKKGSYRACMKKNLSK